MESESTPVNAAPDHQWRVLVVDDNADAAESLATLLRLRGHEVVTAYTGPTALKLAESFAPQAVVLDIGMPYMSGFEVARRLKANPFAEHLRLLIALTGYGQTNDRHRTAEAGFDHHFLKPVDPAELFGLLR